MALYCSFCGEKLENQVWRCPYCGSILKANHGGSGSGNVPGDASGIAPYCIPVNGPLGGQYGTDTVNGCKCSPNDRIIMSNGWKALLAAVFSVIPGLGQIMGIITSIYYMNSMNKDIRNYGAALFKICLAIFPLSVAFLTLSGILLKAVCSMK